MKCPLCPEIPLHLDTHLRQQHQVHIDANPTDMHVYKCKGCGFESNEYGTFFEHIKIQCIALARLMGEEL